MESGPTAGPLTNPTVVLTEKRGLKACAACRINAAIPCHFTATRRGRVKGSKNRKTLEKIAIRNSDARSRTTPSSSIEDTQDGTWPADGSMMTIGETADPSGFSQEQNNSTHTTTTRGQSPLDPFVSTMPTPEPSTTPVNTRVPNTGRNLRSPTRHSMTHRTVQNMAGTFPTGSERDGSSIPRADFSTGRDVHNPLLFLAECARRGWDSSDHTDLSLPLSMVIPSPVTNLPLEDAIRLGRWSKDNLGKIITDQRRFFQHGLHGTKRDVSIGLDPVYQNVIKEEQVESLFASYFCHINCQWGLLDQNVHNPSFVRSRSAFLFTVLLALGATSRATSPTSTPQDRSIALRLWAHLEKLQLVVHATAAKSVEIVQGMLLAQMWALRSSRLVDDQRATRLGMAVRMAGQIGLQLSRCSNRDAELNMSDLRTRLTLVLGESRWESIADRQEISCQGLDLTEYEAEELDRTGPFEDDAVIAADYALYRFEAESKERISRITQSNQSTIALDSERIWIQTYLSSWNEQWVRPQTNPLRRWWFQFMAMRSRLVGILRVAKARTHPGSWTDQMRADLVSVSIDILQGCLSHERAMHMLRPTSPTVFASAILLQLTTKEAPERDLILRVALRLAGEPNEQDGIMTYAAHNGYQILNMLCLSKEVVGTPINDPSNISYNQPSVSSTSEQWNLHELTQQQQPLVDPSPVSTTAATTNNRTFDDIDQLLGLNINTDIIQWPCVNSNAHNTSSNHLTDTNTVWSNFLSHDPILSNPNIPSISIVLPNHNNSNTGNSNEGENHIHHHNPHHQHNDNDISWRNNDTEDPLFNLTEGRQISDDAASNYYFWLASALGS
ncbi:uncharacterized protein L201_004808 [Kwoniella dendrophila CBS 6074]|uniref:Transcription factor domain-containing protein n=1 Tax=Kwoniella dendrophila CBS 6074 TaxID=1295534 RepID=A0AAX4JZA3_9TREE